MTEKKIEINKQAIVYPNLTAKIWMSAKIWLKANFKNCNNIYIHICQNKIIYGLWLKGTYNNCLSEVDRNSWNSTEKKTLNFGICQK